VSITRTYKAAGLSHVRHAQHRQPFLSTTNLGFLLAKDEAFVPQQRAAGIWGCRKEPSPSESTRLSVCSRGGDVRRCFRFIPGLLPAVTDDGSRRHRADLLPPWTGPWKNGKRLLLSGVLNPERARVDAQQGQTDQRLSEGERYEPQPGGPDHLFIRLPQKQGRGGAGGPTAGRDDGAAKAESRETRTDLLAAAYNNESARGTVSTSTLRGEIRSGGIRSRHERGRRELLRERSDRYQQGCFHRSGRNSGPAARGRSGPKLGRAICSDERDPGKADTTPTSVRYFHREPAAVPSQAQALRMGRSRGAS